MSTNTEASGWLLVCHQIPGRIAQGRNEACFKAHDVVLVDAHRAYQRDMAAVKAVSLHIPPSLIPDTYTRDLLDDAVARCLPGAVSGWSRILSANLEALTPELVAPLAADEGQARLLLEHIFHTLMFALQQVCGRTPPAHDDCTSMSGRVRQELHRRICNWLKENYQRPNLTAQAVANEFGISVRYVHQLFAEMPGHRSFLATLRAYRFEQAVHLLRADRSMEWPITEVARRCGFSDPAYFSLAFRQRMGCTPSAFRTSIPHRFPLSTCETATPTPPREWAAR